MISCGGQLPDKSPSMLAKIDTFAIFDLREGSTGSVVSPCCASDSKTDAEGQPLTSWKLRARVLGRGAEAWLIINITYDTYEFR